MSDQPATNARVINYEGCIGILSTTQTDDKEKYRALLTLPSRFGTERFEYRRTLGGAHGSVQLNFGTLSDIGTWADEQMRKANLKLQLKLLAEDWPLDWAHVYWVENLKRWTITVITRGNGAKLIESKVYFSSQGEAVAARNEIFKKLEDMDQAIVERRTLS